MLTERRMRELQLETADVLAQLDEVLGEPTFILAVAELVAAVAGAPVLGVPAANGEARK